MLTPTPTPFHGNNAILPTPRDQTSTSSSSVPHFGHSGPWTCTMVCTPTPRNKTRAFFFFLCPILVILVLGIPFQNALHDSHAPYMKWYFSCHLSLGVGVSLPGGSRVRPDHSPPPPSLRPNISTIPFPLFLDDPGGMGPIYPSMAASPLPFGLIRTVKVLCAHGDGFFFSMYLPSCLLSTPRDTKEWLSATVPIPEDHMGDGVCVSERCNMENEKDPNHQPHHLCRVEGITFDRTRGPWDSRPSRGTSWDAATTRPMTTKVPTRRSLQSFPGICSPSVLVVLPPPGASRRRIPRSTPRSCHIPSAAGLHRSDRTHVGQPGGSSGESGHTRPAADRQCGSNVDACHNHQPDVVSSEG